MSLLQFINEYDRITYSQATREYERTALFRLFSLVGCFGLQLCQTEFDTAHLMEGTKVLRNIRFTDQHVAKEIDRIIGTSQQRTEADAIFLNVPTVFGHPSEGAINYVVEVERKTVDFYKARDRAKGLSRFLSTVTGLKFYPICVFYTIEEDMITDGVPIFSQATLEAMTELSRPEHLTDIPGYANDNAVMDLLILKAMSYVGASVRLDEILQQLEETTSGDCRGYHIQESELSAFIGHHGTLTLNDIFPRTTRAQFEQKVVARVKKLATKGLVLEQSLRYELTREGSDMVIRLMEKEEVG
jgi:hypothetical protein